MARIRAGLVARGSSLRQWAHAWAAAHGEAPDATYHSLRMAIQRRLNHRRPPLGPVALRLVRALRADLGPAVVPDFGESPAGGQPHTGGVRKGAADRKRNEDRK